MSFTLRAAVLLVLPAFGALSLGVSCSGDAFHIDHDSVAGESSGGDDMALSGRGGAPSAPEGGGGAREEGGAAGAPTNDGCETSASCAAGQFCREGACVSCLDLAEPSELEYGPAEPLSVINDSVSQEGLRFGRLLPDDAGLVYVRDFFGGVLWFTDSPDESAGAAISKTDVFESGGLPVTARLPAPLDGFNFFFHRRARMGSEPVRTRLYGATLAADGTVGEEQELPAPFNSEDVVASHSLALSPARAIWGRNLDGMLRIQLVTSPLPPEGEATELRLPLPDGCGFASEFDYTPWLSPDGKTLFFSARRVDEGCMPAANAVTHIYTLALSSAGQPVGSATALTGLAAASVRQSDPSLSPDGCHLLFSAQPEGSMLLYRAPRLH